MNHVNSLSNSFSVFRFILRFNICMKALTQLYFFRPSVEISQFWYRSRNQPQLQLEITCEILTLCFLLNRAVSERTALRNPKDLDTSGIHSVTGSLSTGFDFIFEFCLAQVNFQTCLHFICLFIYLFIFNWLGSPLEIFHEIPDLSCSDIPMNGRKMVCSAERL